VLKEGKWKKRKPEGEGRGELKKKGNGGGAQNGWLFRRKKETRGGREARLRRESYQTKGEEL